MKNNINQNEALCIFVKKKELKKLDGLIIRSFLGPFFLTFFISIFVLVMQFLWRYIEELASKGLSMVVVLKLLFYSSASLVPMALPIAVLLSSIMTLGSTAESLELVAAKSSGTSLTRTIRPLFVLVVFISSIGFFFSNNILPIANFKLKQTIQNIARTMPAIDIQDGMYYDGLKGFTLRVDKKEKDQKTFYGLIVYDHTPGTGGAENIIKASKGSIQMSDDGNYMMLNLEKGVRYSDMNFYSRKEPMYSFSREFFNEQLIIIDISELNASGKDKNNNYVGNQYTMMTVGQLNLVKSEIEGDIQKTSENFLKTFDTYYSHLSSKKESSTLPTELNNTDPQLPFMNHPPPAVIKDTTMEKRTIEKVEWGKTFLTAYTPKEKSIITDVAISQIGSIKGHIEQHQNNIKSKKSNIIRNRVELNRKFTLSLACIFFFFIGAPLGAIIKKGGLGLPLIFSIIIFLIYYIMGTIFEKSVKNGSLDIIGMWYPSFILLPFGIFLTIKASSDSGIFSLSTYTKPFKKLFGKRTTS